MSNETCRRCLKLKKLKKLIAENERQVSRFCNLGYRQQAAYLEAGQLEMRAERAEVEKQDCECLEQGLLPYSNTGVMSVARRGSK